MLCCQLGKRGNAMLPRVGVVFLFLGVLLMLPLIAARSNENEEAAIVIFVMAVIMLVSGTIMFIGGLHAQAYERLRERSESYPIGKLEEGRQLPGGLSDEEPL